jgi:hypothetical protein
MEGAPIMTEGDTDSQAAEKRRDEMLRCHYNQVCTSYRAIDDFRGKLLALWPILGGAAGGVALLALKDTPDKGYLWAIGLFGAFVSAGLAVYEWAQTLRCDQLKKVGQYLEWEMGLDRGTGQFLTLPFGYGWTFRGPEVVREKRDFEHKDSEEIPPNVWPFKEHPIRTGTASFIVYTSVILGWIGLTIWGVALAISG